MHCLVNVDHNGWQRISPEVTIKGFKKCIPSAMDETDDMLWNGSEEDGDVRS